ncbi:type III restriction protein res subunit [Ferrimonas balearica DSM 9799]|uniref:Type III restriction protein res subunit n=1 Tax=Ferrimonas balearica (strain DSM 9799 / CCM 4581 / KCTC 23876 / PAT) TaxID=550540 RepID=E1SLC0_FERBD|nr:DEAD/DEAH box helicase [Ferrimonas balearica]ADN76484.1 type III restriction protein res subunit [Ferrimonas balearica DSM 9799]
MAYTLRPYQQEAVQAVIQHFRQKRSPAVVVLPTGAGKSLVIAELARIAKGRVLVLTHVQELVAQNREKFAAYGLESSVYSAGLGQKDISAKVVFASVQSLARAQSKLTEPYSIVIIDECHRISQESESQYQSLLSTLRQANPALCVLGLTATPYRLDGGWIYQRHYQGALRSTDAKPFDECIYELPISHLIKSGYLTPPTMMDGAVASWLLCDEGDEPKLNPELRGRATALICEQLVEQAKQREGVIIFAASVRHGREVLALLPPEQSALLTADTPKAERQQLIDAFKARQLKFLVNVAVLTTGFDAPHVDLIALLRRTDSVALFQQMVGRGLRLSPGKTDCLVLDYAGNGYSLYSPEVGEPRPHPDTSPVSVPCPKCGHDNAFWGKTDDNGLVLEHFGRRCQGYQNDEHGKAVQCDYRFRYKECPDCLTENDIAARDCHGCGKALADPDKRLAEVLRLKDYKVLRCAGVSLAAVSGKQGARQIEVTWHDEDGDTLSRRFGYDSPGQRGLFYHQFVRNHLKSPGQPLRLPDVDAVVSQAARFRHPDFVIARFENKRYWKVIETLFDYQGRYRKADSAYG